MTTTPANTHQSTPGVGWATAHSTRTRTREGPCGHRHAHSLQRRGSHSGAGGDRNESALGEASETSCHGNSVCRSADVQGKQATHTRTGAVNTLAAQKVGSSNHPRLPVKIWSGRSSIITADYATCSGSAVRTKTHAVGAWARILCQRTAPLFPRVGTPASCLPRPTHARVLGGVDVGSFDKVWPRSQP